MKKQLEVSASILANTEVFDYLKEKVGERKTRIEAYCDLLDKSLAGFISPFLRKHEYELQAFQCHVTVSDLATDWHWHRATVRSFIETLESMGQLARTRLPKSMVITMPLQNNILFNADAVQRNSGIVPQLRKVLSDWINGNTTSAEVGTVCGQIVHQAMCDAGLQDNLPIEDCRALFRMATENMDKRLLEIQSTAMETIALAAIQKVSRRLNPEYSTELLEYFCMDLEGRWQSFIELSTTLAEYILNLGKEKNIDCDDDGKVLMKDFRSPFMSIVAKALENVGSEKF